VILKIHKTHWDFFPQYYYLTYIPVMEDRKRLGKIYHVPYNHK